MMAPCCDWWEVRGHWSGPDGKGNHTHTHFALSKGHLVHPGTFRRNSHINLLYEGWTRFIVSMVIYAASGRLQVNTMLRKFGLLWVEPGGAWSNNQKEKKH